MKHQYKLKKAKLTRKERKAVEKAERKKIEEQQKEQELRYRIIKSTQEVIPIKDIYNGVVITKDNRYVKILEFKPINFVYMSNAAQNRIISTFASMLQAVPVSLQFKAISKKADIDNTIASVKEYYELEENPKRKRMLEAYMSLLRKTALSVGISRRFFVIFEFSTSVNNNGSDFEKIVADLNSIAARVKSYMEQNGNIFLASTERKSGKNRQFENEDVAEDSELHKLFYQLLNRKKSETIPFEEHISGILENYNEVAEDGEIPTIMAPELVAPQWIDFTHYKHIVIDGKFYTFGYIPSYGYNMQVYAGWMALFINAGEGVDVDIFLTKYAKEDIYNKIGMQVKLKRADAITSHDTDSDYHQRLDTISSGEYMMRALADGEDFYYLTTMITVVADSIEELEYKYRELEKRVKGNGMSLRRASFMMRECFESMLPLCSVNKDIFMKARRNILTSGAAACYPFISYEMQDPDGIMVGTNRANNSLVSIDMFDTAIHPNANAVICGSSGFGKTFTSQLFALRMSLMDVQTFVIAPLKGIEDYKGGCDAVGGQFVSMDPSSFNYINIMDIRIPDEEALTEATEKYGDEDPEFYEEMKTFFEENDK